MLHLLLLPLKYPAYTGRFCEEDLDGCTELTCFDGVECRDVAAPGVGVICGPCPTGYSGNGLNCMGKYIAIIRINASYDYCIFYHRY